MKIILKILLIGALTIAFAQDTLSAAAKNDSLIAAQKFEATKQTLGTDYQPVPLTSYQPPDIGKVVSRMAIGLGVILVLLYVLYYLTKKIRKVESPGANNNQSVIQLLDSKFLGAGKNIFLIKAGLERILVVGASQEGMRTLTEIQGEEAKLLLETYNSKPVTAAQFSATVDHLLRRFKKEGG
ncbi:MAG: flagellar biosynthetic protein FliO [Fibromonadales bacterium]|nr:flagellar biosynthetic protein FliO [Fibromonadales bacterium]